LRILEKVCSIGSCCLPLVENTSILSWLELFAVSQSRKGTEGGRFDRVNQAMKVLQAAMKSLPWSYLQQRAVNEQISSLLTSLLRVLAQPGAPLTCFEAVFSACEEFLSRVKHNQTSYSNLYVRQLNSFSTTASPPLFFSFGLSSTNSLSIISRLKDLLHEDEVLGSGTSSSSSSTSGSSSSSTRGIVGEEDDTTSEKPKEHKGITEGEEQQENENEDREEGEREEDDTSLPLPSKETGEALRRNRANRILQISHSFLTLLTLNDFKIKNSFGEREENREEGEVVSLYECLRWAVETALESPSSFSSSSSSSTSLVEGVARIHRVIEKVFQETKASKKEFQKLVLVRKEKEGSRSLLNLLLSTYCTRGCNFLLRQLLNSLLCLLIGQEGLHSSSASSASSASTQWIQKAYQKLLTQLPHPEKTKTKTKKKGKEKEEMDKESQQWLQDALELIVEDVLCIS
jgi:hypothetical protein